MLFTRANDKVLLKEAEEKANLLINENRILAEDLSIHKDTLRKLRETLAEVAVFNSNLANVNKLFTIHPTTLDEKKSIVERFENVETIKESTTLYKTISAELKNAKNTISEAVESAINKNVSGNTGEPLLESTNVEANKHAAGLSRIQELINYNEVDCKVLFEIVNYLRENHRLELEQIELQKEIDE